VRYIDYPTIEEAKEAKFKAGAAKYRENGTWVGEPLEELFQELLDGLCYAERCEEEYGLQFAFIKQRMTEIANTVRTHRRRVQMPISKVPVVSDDTGNEGEGQHSDM